MNNQNNQQAVTGYSNPEYAASLSQFGTPSYLAECGGSLLIRAIPDCSEQDAMGCYPLFTCQDWTKLHYNLQNLSDDLVSIALVADPFGAYDEEYLHNCFPNIMVPFKEHFVIDMRCSPEKVLSKHHRYYVRKALKEVAVDICEEPITMIYEWYQLYQNLIQRHHLTGIKAFSFEAFAKQLNIPGIVAIRASARGELIGAHLWYMQGDVAYSHLAASSPLGYELMSAYAIYWKAIEYFAEKVRWINIGAGAGIADKEDSGLTRFKRGWATGTRSVYFCGRILNHKKYEILVKSRNITPSAYFPLYRKGELA